MAGQAGWLCGVLEKVKEIYKLGLKHGMKLAAISGVNGAYTEKDIRKLANLLAVALNSN